MDGLFLIYEYLEIGNFIRVFPQISNVDYYSQFFETQRHNNLLLWRYLKCGSSFISDLLMKTR